jgi:GNAT superfamily N-acetyltransferase
MKRHPRQQPRLTPNDGSMALTWTTMTTFTLRAARPDEIDLLVAIDDDAGRLYAEAGMIIELAPDDPFVQLERTRWLAATMRGDVLLAEDGEGSAMGFTASGDVDGRPYLDQLSVRPAFMRRGLGTALLSRAIEAAAGELWLTTYAHLPFNRPFYERAGFRVVAEAQCGPELRDILRIQREALPRPEQRVAMVYRPRS